MAFVLLVDNSGSIPSTLPDAPSFPGVIPDEEIKVSHEQCQVWSSNYKAKPKKCLIVIEVALFTTLLMSIILF